MSDKIRKTRHADLTDAEREQLAREVAEIEAEAAEREDVGH